MNLLSRAFASLLAVLTVVPSAYADPPAQPETREVAAGREAFDRGLKSYEASDFEGARIAWAESYAAFPSIVTLRNLAGVEYMTDHCVEALKHLRIYGRSKNADPAYLAKELPRITTSCNRRVGHVRVFVPGGVAVLLDGKRATDLSDVLDVVPGDHVLAAEGPDVKDSRSVTVPAGETVEVRFSSTVATSATKVVSTETERAPEGSPFWTPSHTWAVGLGVAAVVVLGVATGVGVQANSEKSSAEGALVGGQPSACVGSTSTPCAILQNETSAERRDATLADVGFGLGAALAVAAGVAWFLPTKSAQKATLRLVPSIGTTNAGLIFDGRF